MDLKFSKCKTIFKPSLSRFPSQTCFKYTRTILLLPFKAFMDVVQHSSHCHRPCRDPGGWGRLSPGRNYFTRRGQVSGHSLLAQTEVMGAALRPEQNRNSTRRCLRSEGFTGEKLPCAECVTCCRNALGSGSFHTSEILKHLLDSFRHLSSPLVL